tara:strand:- start:439 stop:666 length:228 start_codon:yes stop_codon:yes gene_type:complete
MKNDHMDTPLHYAGFGREDAEVIKYLLDQGADVSVMNEHSQIPLSLAQMCSYSEETVALLQAASEKRLQEAVRAV